MKSQSRPFVAAKAQWVWESTNKVDSRTLQLVRVRNQKSPVTTAMRILSYAGEHALVWIGLGGLLGLVDRRRRAAWVTAGLVGPASIVFNFGIKQAFRRERPPRESEGKSRSGRKRVSYSFPSAHATSSFAVATVAARVDGRARMPALTMAYAISCSRVHLGKHFPTDVVAGGILGVVGGRIIWRLLPVSGSVNR